MKFRDIEAFMRRVSYHGVSIRATQDFDRPNLVLFHIAAKVPDSQYPSMTVDVTHFKKVPLDYIYDEDHLKIFLRKELHMRAMHEADEFFKIDGVAAFNPHQENPT